MEQMELLKLLEQNARVEIKDLATVLKETEEQVAASIKSLEDLQIICGYHTVINWDRTNQESVYAIIEVSATPERDAGYEKIAREIYNYSEVSSLYLISGSIEFIVIIDGKTMQEVAQFVAQKLAPIHGVHSTTTHFVLKRYKLDGVIMEKEEKDQERMLITP